MRHYAITIEAKVHWGYSIRTFPASATQRSFNIPPPTSIIGALAYAYASTKGINREYSSVKQPYTTYTVEFIEEFGTKYATIHLLEPIKEHTLQTIRYFTMSVQAPKTDVEKYSKSLKVAEMFAPVQIGYIACPASTLLLIVLSNKPLPRATAWSVLRIGSKESLISVQAVWQSEIQLTEVREGESLDIVNTCYLADLAQPQPQANYIIERTPVPLTEEEWFQWYSFKIHSPTIERNLIAPLPELYTPVKITKDCFISSLKFYDRRLVILIPKECILQ